MRADASSPSTRLIRQALELMAALGSDDPGRRRLAGEQSGAWRAASPAHEQAWQAAEQRWAAVGRLAPELGRAIAIDEGLPRSLARRRVLGESRTGAGLLAVASLLLGGGRWWWLQPAFESEWQTAHARHLPRQGLPDGSEIALAADSALRVIYWRDRREILLAHGRAYFEVARDEHRPFVVQTRLAQVRVLGTGFSVTDRGGSVQVAVSHGRVEVVALAGGRSAQILHAGQRVVLDRAGRIGAVQPGGAGAPRDLLAWRDGWWVFEGTPLAEMALEVNAYLAHPVRVAPGAEALRLTGSFRIARPAELFESLPAILPVSVAMNGDAWLIAPR